MACVVFTGGGTGGHIYPGLAVVDELRNKINSTKIDGKSPDVKIVWIGSSKGMDKDLVEKSGSVDKFIGIPCGKLRRYFSFQNFVDLFKIFAGFVSAFFQLAKLKPVVIGGGQEMGLRSGTENVAGTVGFAAAAKMAKEHANGNCKKYEKLAKIFRENLIQNLDGKIEPKFLGNPKRQLVSFIPVCFDGVDAERLIYKLEDEEIYVSTGAACAASKGEKSHVLSAIGLTDSEIAGSLRISLGMLNDEENVKLAVEKIATAVKQELERTNG